MSLKQRRLMLVEEHPVLSIRRQCKLLNISRSGLSYKPAGESELNLSLMKIIDNLHTRYPFMGQGMIKDQLEREGYTVNIKRVARLMMSDANYCNSTRTLYQPSRTAKHIFPLFIKVFADKSAKFGLGS